MFVQSENLLDLKKHPVALAVEEREENARGFRVLAEYHFSICSVKTNIRSINVKDYLDFFMIVLL